MDEFDDSFTYDIGSLWLTLGFLSMAPILYTAEGKEISERLWKETMEELSFVKPEDIVRKVAS